MAQITLEVALSFNFGASGCPATDAIKARSLALSDYFSLMQHVESDNSKVTDISVMITKFRKLYYGSKLWSYELVRGTEDIAQFASSDTTKAIQKSHEVLTNDKQDAYDIAHLFAIMDASNHNGPVTPLPDSILKDKELAKILEAISPTVDDRLMASGWLGDLSEIAGNFYINKHQKAPKTKQEIINQFGANYKTIANVDGMAIVKHFQLSGNQHETVSQVLSDYFTSVKPSLNPYKVFASSIGFELNGSQITNASSWQSKQEQNLRTCTAFYLARELGFDFDEQLLKTLLKKLLQDMSAAITKLDIQSDEKTALNELKTKLDASNANSELDKDLMIIATCTLVWLGFYDEDLSIQPLLEAYEFGLQQAILKTDADLNA
ncbi:hypothetical protein [Celerinatantimonas sp. MCCC 1A17872]|uniref:hypothetical protein n=1 Tax=Celerinatantimonas sp. MCCC 1A17872 TaxID=3177514 RepID=UPI0038C17E80